MKYCNDCFAKMSDSARRCKACNSRDIRFFETKVSSAQAAGVIGGSQSPTNNLDKLTPSKSEDSDLGQLKLDPIYVREPKVESSDSGSKILYFSSDSNSRELSAKRIAKNQRKSRRSAFGKTYRKQSLKRVPRRRIRNVLGGSVGLMGVCVYVLYSLWAGATWLPSVGLAPKSFNAWGVIDDFLAGFEAEPKRFFQIPEAPAEGVFAAFEDDVEGIAPTWDPCRPIYWTVNPNDEPNGARRQLLAAFAEISEATGLKFEYIGETSEEFDSERTSPNAIYEQLSSKWNPVLVSFLPGDKWDEATQETNGLPGEVLAGFAGPLAEQSGGTTWRWVYVSGAIALSTDAFSQMLNNGAVAEAKAVMMHEIGHLVGLDHVNESSELMYGDNVGKTNLGPGDRRGLAAMGSGACLKDSHYPKRPAFTTNHYTK